MKLTPQEIRETIQDIASRVNDPAYRAFYQVTLGDNAEHAGYSPDAQDDLEFLLGLLDNFSEECFELTPAGRELLGSGDD